MKYNSFRLWAVALGVMAVFAAAPAQAGFLGDSVSVSLTVHTTGAIDQIVWASTPAVVALGGPDLLGDSWPNGVTSPLLWDLDLEDLTITLTVLNPNLVPTTVEPMLFVISGLDAMPLASAAVNPFLNQFGISNAEISVAGDTLTVSSALLASVAAGGSLTTQIVLTVVPEASSIVMTALMATGLVGGYVARRRRRNG